MRAAHVVRLDGPAALELVDVPEPAAAEGSVVLDVHAAGVAWPDLLLTRGQYQLRPEPPFSPGSEVAGVVRSAPAGSGLVAGQRAAVLTGVGGWQEVVVATPSSVLPLPDGLAFDVGAGTAFNYLTVHFALTRRARLAAGETVLVHGASGGIGTAGLQLAKAYGARALAVVSTEAKAEAARAAGADEVLLADGFLARAKELTGGRGVDVVLDPVGGDRFTDSLRALAPEGRLLVVGFTGGEIPTVRVNRLLLNNISVAGVGWGAFLAVDTGYLQEQWAELRELVAGGLQPLPVQTRPLEQAADVLREMDARTLTGKVVLTLR